MKQRDCSGRGAPVSMSDGSLRRCVHEGLHPSPAMASWDRTLRTTRGVSRTARTAPSRSPHAKSHPECDAARRWYAKPRAAGRDRDRDHQARLRRSGSHGMATGAYGRRRRPRRRARSSRDADVSWSDGYAHRACGSPCTRLGRRASGRCRAVRLQGGRARPRGDAVCAALRRDLGPPDADEPSDTLDSASVGRLGSAAITR
jgi:hypothetical protein